MIIFYLNYFVKKRVNVFWRKKKNQEILKVLNILFDMKLKIFRNCERVKGLNLREKLSKRNKFNDLDIGVGDKFFKIFLVFIQRKKKYGEVN